MKARYIIIPVVVVGALALTVWVLIKTFNQQPKYDLYEVRRGAVAKTVSVAGSVISDQKFELGFLTPGIIKEVLVKVGDRVKAGDLLVAQDVSVLQAQANQARASIAAASALLSKTKNHLRLADIAVLDRALESARVGLETAQRNLQDVYRSRDTDRNSAAAALQGAETAYQNALNAYNAQLAVIDQSTVNAQMALTNATNALNSAQMAYNQVMNRYNMGQATMAELQQAQLVLATANMAYLSARTAYDTAVQQANFQKISASGGVDSARSQLDSARAAYNSATNGLDLKINNAQNILVAAQAAYNLAQAQYQQSLAPTLGADIASSSAQVAAAVASLRIVEAQIAKASIKAPLDGLITAVNAKAHEISPLAGPAVVLETEGVFQVEAFISEVDVQKVLPGAAVKLIFDAMPGLEMTGAVVSIDPAATISLGVVNYKVKVILSSAMESTTQLKPAMTADLEILTDQRENVLFVPRKALIKSDGGYKVKVLIANTKQSIEREVQVGLLGDSEAEIISGLSEGDSVVLREL